VAGFLRRSGGMASSNDVDNHIEHQLAPIRERSALERRASEKSWQARRLEKAGPDEAISLYRESIKLWKEIISSDGADYVYSRLNQELCGWYTNRGFRHAGLVHNPSPPVS
jgi:hypothetical protein